MIGATTWVIADGYIPPASTGPEPAMTSHDSACILNAGDAEARVEITLFFTDREPVGPYPLTIAPRRAFHQRFNDLEGPEPVPVEVLSMTPEAAQRALPSGSGITPDLLNELIKQKPANVGVALRDWVAGSAGSGSAKN